MRDFKFFIETKIVRKVSPDVNRAGFLIENSKQEYSNLLEQINKIGVKDTNSNNFIKICYDILMEIIRAKMLEKGYSSSGHGAHEAEVSFSKEIGFKDKEVKILDELRTFRNRILYYGRKFDKEYAEKIIKFTKDKFNELV